MDSFTEFYNKKTGLIVGRGHTLFSEQSPYQRVEVFETDTWGNMMTIDGLVMLSEKDEFVYHEMLSHVPLCVHPNPEKVLIIGGGDGGTAREVMKHSSVKHVDMVEIDEAVVRAAKAFLPDVGDFNNPKLKVHFEDGIKFLKGAERSYDVIIVDGSDPIGPAEGLFSKSFFESCKKALNEGGILSAQSETPWLKQYHPSMKRLFKANQQLFKISKMYLASIPLYPTGLWSMAYASDLVDPLSQESRQRIEHRYAGLGALKYYNPDVHYGSFALPNFVKAVLG